MSNPRPQLVSGGDVLVRASLGGRDLDDVTIRLGRDDVTDDFVPQDDGSALGLVTGLEEGHNRLELKARGAGDSLWIDNHPSAGPVLSGARQLPFACETQAFGLPAAESPTCMLDGPQVTYRYRTTAGQFRALADPAQVPADAATVTVAGETLPYVVRLEQGTIDRAVYQVAGLYAGQDPSPTGPERGWNQRLAYTFGGGCNSGYHQGAGTGGVLDDRFLSRGFVVASSSLNVLDNNCSTVISAEAAMMVKEHVVETYGEPLFTTGWGGSGGAIQQYSIADAYPGILDGIIPGVSYPDPFTTGGPVTDCRLLNHFFDGSGSDFTEAQRTAVAGYPTYSTCRSWELTFASRATATDSCHASVPVAERWDEQTNPDGIICNSAVQSVNQLGRDPRTGFPRSLLDNTGVQYGLAAFRDGVITAEQFVRLNEQIGGLDFAGRLVPERSAADRLALHRAYADGLVSHGSQGLAETAIIDHRQDLDLAGVGADIHTTEWSYVTRARLEERNGTSANQVIIESLPIPQHAVLADAYVIDQMDAWLTALAADDSRAPLARRVIDNRPGTLSDGCYLGQELVHAELTYPASGPCAATYPVGANPRLVAGQSLPMTQLACHTTAIRARDYPGLSDDQVSRLRAAFPRGVCDYDRRGVGERAPIAPWLSYGSDPDRVFGPWPVRG
ncbi:DUF6351 family protein [Nocardioides insulae]|uniref:DUF6351 family protein n=1 Tax=Nocardioides insulae TaxID=394734 RepID=UPI0012F8FFEB|nr:DUF6351 family protein [Nocardioides insulae]